MKAIEFSNQLARVVTNFFSDCLTHETMPLGKIQEITFCCSDFGFTLRLETAKYAFSQEFEVSETGIDPLYFEIYA